MRNYKKFLALTIAASMVFGNSLMVLAEGTEAGDSQSVSVEGTGTYEGDEVDYPANSIKLPTLSADTYSYLADPNGLIDETEKAKYSSASFDEGALWFLSAENTYTANSAAVEVTSQNANDINVSVTLEVSNADTVSQGVGISSDSTFTDDTNANLYFAIVDTDENEETKATDVPLTSMSSAVTMTKTIAGVPDNYVLCYEDGAYSYKTLTSGEEGFAAWNSFGFELTGAINTAGTWDDITTLPTLKVTWSWEDYSDAPAVPTEVFTEATSIRADGGTVTIALPDDVTIDEVLRTSTTASSGFKALDDSYYSTEYSTNSVELTVNIAEKTEYAQIKLTFIGSDEVIVLNVEF